jgi:hypothetical protein
VSSKRPSSTLLYNSLVPTYFMATFLSNGGVYLYVKASLVKHQTCKMVHIFEQQFFHDSCKVYKMLGGHHAFITLFISI